MPCDSRVDRLVQDCLDRRVDPLDDPKVIEALHNNPDALQEFSRLHHRLAGLAATERATQPRRIASRMTWLVAAAALATAVVWSTGDSNAASGNVRGGRLLAASAEVRSPSHTPIVSWTIRERVDAASPAFPTTHVVVTETRRRSL